ncbi:uncharacterized protein TNCV_3876451 [Trichonephila clavipes]|uniref:Integrase zinc-binding domain-containing protein n=1 Tax=Trichonephila clavipes TaxID=2585209 RepID=A0A8X6T0N0_TRICX|nr:uncharacterized protein TNCV_3876451 [Trichonephila clavipes]
MKTRHQKPEESLQECAFEIQRLNTLAFSDFSATVREMIYLEYFVDGLTDEEIQRTVRMADVQDLKSALLYALKFEAASQASCIDLHKVEEHFFWNNVRNDVDKWCRTCNPCAARKGPRKRTRGRLLLESESAGILLESETSQRTLSKAAYQLRRCLHSPKKTK